MPDMRDRIVDALRNAQHVCDDECHRRDHTYIPLDQENPDRRITVNSTTGAIIDAVMAVFTDLGHTDACVHPDQHDAVIREWEDSKAEVERLTKDLAEMTALRDNALRAAEHADQSIDVDLEGLIGDGLASLGVEWEGSPDDSAPPWLLDAVVDLVRPVVAHAVKRAEAADAERDALKATLALHTDCRTDISIGDLLRAVDDHTTEQAQCERCGGTRIEPGSEDYDAVAHRDNPYTGEPCSVCQQGAALDQPTGQDQNKSGWRERARTRVGDRVDARMEELMAEPPMSVAEFDEAMRRNKAEAEAFLNQQSHAAFGDHPTDTTGETETPDA
ncbi:MAG: hypothetical protein JWO67_1065 [Streptosporangiaceae bacterium]|nr:hypothetical protein [Streptosporangiaceae bacterium]